MSATLTIAQIKMDIGSEAAFSLLGSTKSVVNDMPIMRSQKEEQVLGPSELYVLELLRQFGSEGGESQGIQGIAAGHGSPSPGLAAERGNSGRGAEIVCCPKKGAMILLGYCK